MRESNFYSDEFEQLIRGKTEQYKMYPSERVWKGVHGSLHTKRKWFFMGMSLLIMGILIFAGKELIAPSAHPTLGKTIITTTSIAGGINSDKQSSTHIPAPELRRSHHSDNTTNASANDHGDRSGDESADGWEDQEYRGVTITISHLVISQPDLSEFLSHTVKLPSGVPALPISAKAIEVEERNGIASAEGGANGGAGNGVAGGGSGNGGAGGGNDGAEGRGGMALHNSPASKSLASIKSSAEPVNDPDAISDSMGHTVKNTINFSESIADQQRVNWLADYAVYNLPRAAKRNRTQLQLYLTPTVSYRSLSGGNLNAKSPLVNVPLSLFHSGDVNDYVDHNPSLGFTVGGMMQYRLTRNLTVKGGLQFAFSRYTIKAYASNTTQQATIALNSFYGYYLDSISTYTNIGNFAGHTQVSISNDYYQLAAPVGFELRVMGNERLQLNLGATIQPTYLLNTNSYLLSTDFTSYVKEPSLMRRWNVNGALEAFLSYKTRSGLRWQIGPEFRYQMLSTYNSQYSIREHLKGYGLKFGIVKSLP